MTCGEEYRPMSLTPGKQRILVVDDEPPIRDVVSTILRYEGYEVDEASDASEALAKLRDDPPNLLVLDIMLPDRSGVELTGYLRAQGNAVPIILLTARDALVDKVVGLDVGADDYLTKPFVLAELIARVQAILRRSTSDMPAGRLRFVDVELNERSREVRRGGVLVELTATEFNLLRYFLEYPGSVLSKDQILAHVWHYDFDGKTGVVETYVSYLRRKLDALGPSLIHTVRAVGFILRESEPPV
jgi:two-component system OmpR family response regulator